MDLVCRTCFGTTNLLPIQDTVYGKILITSLLSTTIAIFAREDDELPMNICNICIRELHRFYRFKSKCLTNQSILSTALRQLKNSKINVVNYSDSLKRIMDRIVEEHSYPMKCQQIEQIEEVICNEITNTEETNLETFDPLEIKAEDLELPESKNSIAQSKDSKLLQKHKITVDENCSEISHTENISTSTTDPLYISVNDAKWREKKTDNKNFNEKVKCNEKLHIGKKTTNFSDPLHINMKDTKRREEKKIYKILSEFSKKNKTTEVNCNAEKVITNTNDPLCIGMKDANWREEKRIYKKFPLDVTKQPTPKYCKSCYFVFSSLGRLDAHQRKYKHGRHFQIVCEHCKKRTTRLEFESLVRSRPKNSPLECPSCHRPSTAFLQFEYHNPVTVKCTNYTCSCEKRFITFNELVEHENICKNK